MRKYRVVVFPKADTMLNRYTHYLALKNINASERLYREFWNAVEDLRENPFLYPLYDIHTGKNFRRALLCRRYLVIYTVTDDKVYIYAVVDGRMNPETIRRELGE